MSDSDGGVAEVEYRDLKLRIVPQTPKLGAVIEGVDGRETLHPDAIAVIKDALMDYKVVFFRNQNLTMDEQQGFADQFGPPFVDQINQSIDDESNPGLTDVRVVAHFHSDYMYIAEPPSWSMLQLDSVPPVGGDTMWVDLVTGYEELSEPIRNLINPLYGFNAVDQWSWSDEMLKNSYLANYGEMTPQRIAEIREAIKPHEHPLVRLIPETGKPNYWVSARFTRSIVGLSELESRALLDLLFAHQLNPKYVYRWRWQTGDIAFWDHRTTIHSGIADFGSFPRHGRRASIAPQKVLPAF